MNLLAPDKKEHHRYQIIKVIRNDKPAEVRIDLGKENATIPQIAIPGSVTRNRVCHIEHTVGELQEMADQIRGRPAWNIGDHPELDAWRDHKDKTGRVIFS